MVRSDLGRRKSKHTCMYPTHPPNIGLMESWDSVEKSNVGTSGRPTDATTDVGIGLKMEIGETERLYNILIEDRIEGQALL